MKVLTSILAVLFIAVTPAFAEATEVSPRGEIESTINQLVEIVEKYPGDNNKNARRSKLRDVIAPGFDFEEMSKRSLGTHWKNITETQQSEFVEVFSDLLASTYLARVEHIEKNMVTIDSEKIVAPKALVKTSVTHKGDVFPIHYKLINRGGAWKVYDVIIENIGLVANYRNEFAGIIRKEKFAGLITKLKNKANKKAA